MWWSRWQLPFDPYLFTEHSYDVRVDFIEGRKPEDPEDTVENPRSTVETNYNSTHIRPKLETQHVVTIWRSPIELVTTANQV